MGLANGAYQPRRPARNAGDDQITFVFWLHIYEAGFDHEQCNVGAAAASKMPSHDPYRAKRAQPGQRPALQQPQPLDCVHRA